MRSLRTWSSSSCSGRWLGARSRPDSDLDVAVRCDGPADLDALYLLLAPRLATSLLDLVDLRRTGSLLAFQVARHGQVLYERDAGCVPELSSRWPHAATATPTSSAAAQRRSIHAFLERHGLE